ncbi:MAG: hypothetical protein FRX49_10919 [Trebouxia sp. A1-2]|nr:MAG: hypothetical protein FRX49_10919 [Trebouxia sp. A1-2]
MVSKWLCCTSRTEDDKPQSGVEKPSRGRGYSSFSITQDLAASDATAYGAVPISPLGPTAEASASSNASMHAQLSPQMPHNPYRRSDTAWAPYIASGALFPPTSQPSQHHAAVLTPTSQPQQLHSRESIASALHTGETASKQLHSRRSTSKQSKRSPDVSDSKLTSMRALRSGDSRLHPELNADVLSKHSALYSGHSAYSAALHPGQGYADPILDSHQRVAAMLRSGDSTVHPILKSVPVQQPNMGYGQPDPGERQHTTGDRHLDRQPQGSSALYTGESSMQPGAVSEHQTHHPHVGTHQGSQSPMYSSHDRAHQETSYSKAPNHLRDERAHAMLSSSTPDRMEEPTLGRQASASSGSNDEAEQRSARGPAPTGPPSTVSRSGRVVHRAAKGIYLTLERQSDGRNKLLRIRFNRNLYSKKDAEAWWTKSKQALAQMHNLSSETTAVFSEPGWLLRLEGHIEDLAQITQLHAALTSLAVTAGAAGPSNANVVESAGFNTASPASADQLGLEDQSSGCTAGPAGGRMQIQALAKPDWSDDSDALRGRLLEMGGVAGLQTDTDCLLLKDLCRPGLGDSAFLDLTDLELQEHHASEVRGAHEVIRHTSMRLFWGRAAGPHEELPWGKFWDLFPSTLHGADTTTMMRQALAVIDNRRLFQAAVSGMACEYVTAGDVDKAFPPGQGIPDSFQRLMQVAKLQKLRTSSKLAQQHLLESGVDILDTVADPDALSDRQAASVDAQLYAAGFWRHEQDALLASYQDSISGLAFKLSQANRGVYTTQQVSLRADGSEGCSGVALLDSKGSDAGLLAFGLARHMLHTGRWTHVGYAEMGGVGNEEEAAARMSAALGLPSYPLPVNETLRLVVDASNGFKWPEDVIFITAMLSTILGDTANIQVVTLLPEASTLPSGPWTVDTPPRMTRDVGVAVLQSNLGHSQIRFSQLGQLVEGCQQQPCLVRIAGRALAEGCVAPQIIVSQASGPLRQNSDAGIFQGRFSHAAAEEAGQLPQWLLQVLSQDERMGLLRLSIFPLAFTLDMATSVLPSIWEQTQIQSLIQKLHRLGFVKHNPAHKTYQTEPYLRPHLVALAQQQPDALYSPSLLGWSHACLRTCTLATALFHLHAQVSALRVIDRDRGQIDGLLNALAHDLPAKALPVVIEVISKHMEPLSHRLSLRQKQQLCNNVGHAAEETGDLLGEVECAVQLAEQGCMDEAHAVQGLAGSMHLVERALGPDHPLLAHILLHQARLLRQRQQYHQANEALQSCLSIQETALGLDHPEVADTLQEMALTLQAQGLQDRAEPVLRQCLAIRSHAQGMQHPDTAAAWRTTKQCLGHVHPKLAQVLVDMAALKARQKRPTEAQHLLRRSIVMWRQLGAGCHPALLSALETLANLCRVIASLPRGPSRRLYTVPHSILDTFPSQHPIRTPSHPPKQLPQKHPTSSSVSPMAVPSLMHPYPPSGQMPYQTAESAAAPEQEISSRFSTPILPAETAAASEAAAAAACAPSRGDESLHGMRSSHHGPVPVTASSQGADDKPLCGSTGKSVSIAMVGAASAAAAGSGSAYTNSSLPAFRLPPPIESPTQAFGANPGLVQAVNPQAATWHDSSSLTATPNAAGQDHRQQHEHEGVSPGHSHQNHLDLQSSEFDPRQHVGDHGQWTHLADDQAHLNHPAPAQSEVQARNQVQSQDQGKLLSQVQSEYNSAWSPQPLLSVGTTTAPARLHGHDSLAGCTNASLPKANLTAARSSASLSGSASANQVSKPHAPSSSPLLSSSDQTPMVARAGQPPSSPLGPATSHEAQLSSAELCSVGPTLSAQPLSSPGVQEAAEEESMRQLSVRESALRSLSSKGIQLGRSASNKASRFGHARLESGSEIAGKSVQGSRQHLQDGDSVHSTASNQDKDRDGMGGIADGHRLSQRAEAVRALSFRLDMGSKT